MEKLILEELQKINNRFDKLEGRFDKLETRFDKLEGRFDKLEGRFDKLETRFNGLEKQVNENTQILKALEHKFDVMKAQQDSMSKTISLIKSDMKVNKTMTIDNMSNIGRLEEIIEDKLI